MDNIEALLEMYKRKAPEKQIIQNRFVIFLDILGFKYLVENNDLELDCIQKSSGPLVDVFGLVFVETNRLTKVFSEFHRTLESSLNLSKMSCKFTSITFSDSAFIATNNFENAINTAVVVMRNFLKSGVPVRCGIAYGTFETIRFKSDIMSDNGEHSSHFLGTGVVRSHEAEACGIKGLRILVHPSVNPFLIEQQKSGPSPKEKTIFYQECTENEIENKVGVKYEINYWDYNKGEESKAWKEFQFMWSNSPLEARIHYESTAPSINSMRVARGFKPIQNFKLKSIPR